MGGDRYFSKPPFFYGKIAGQVSYNIQIMKSNKGILTVLANLGEMVLQARINPRPPFHKHMDELLCEIAVLKNQLLPSPEFVHYLVEREFYNLKGKLNAKLTTTPLENICLCLTITINDKIASVSHIAEVWKVSVRAQEQKEVSREGLAHEMLSLISKVCEQVGSTQMFSQVIRNCEGSKKYIIDFQIEVADQRTHTARDLIEMEKMWINRARLDSSRSLEVQCYINDSLAKLYHKKSPYSNSKNEKEVCRSSSEDTRVDSIELKGSLRSPRRIKSGDNHQSGFELYDSELDVTILSSDSEEWGSRRLVGEVRVGQPDDEFQLLIEQAEINFDELFVGQNETLFLELDKAVTTLLV